MSSDSNKCLEEKPRAVVQCCPYRLKCVDMCWADSRGLTFLDSAPPFLDLFFFIFVYKYLPACRKMASDAPEPYLVMSVSCCMGAGN